ncbi:hypothetical protein R1sor_008972 [Riccia sorocarpa]|uniref:B box-type domain-containing protein n=1 Tax=Riccia sorocarpa TaxID=122646 RepID=A0ABD3H4P6_9MARC
MRTLCDVCEAAPARLFCAADEAALCVKCDEKVHGCNKLASRHVRLELAEARAMPRCDICENAPAFFFCGIDGTSLCLQCDMDVHIGGKKTHERYLLMGQRVELPTKVRQDDLATTKDNAAKDGKVSTAGNEHIHHHHHHHYHHHHHDGQEDKTKPVASGDWNNSNAPAVAIAVGDEDLQSPASRRLSRLIDLNARPAHLQQFGHTSKEQELASSDDECVGVVPEITPRSSSENSD